MRQDQSPYHFSDISELSSSQSIKILRNDILKWQPETLFLRKRLREEVSNPIKGTWWWLANCRKWNPKWQTSSKEKFGCKTGKCEFLEIQMMKEAVKWKMLQISMPFSGTFLLPSVYTHNLGISWPCVPAEFFVLLAEEQERMQTITLPLRVHIDTSTD